MNPSPDFSRTCKDCEALCYEERSTGASCYRCGHSGPRKGYMMGTVRPIPFIPAWCPKLISERQRKEAEK